MDRHLHSRTEHTCTSEARNPVLRRGLNAKGARPIYRDTPRLLGSVLGAEIEQLICKLLVLLRSSPLRNTEGPG